ncbi:hypothetical protein M426DRAFT_21816 [Hypoxylon sp. CI-4A]|nr:hypothetical protein M426DRAFT_21816 [Hypoxylon sp. CI-4A]
MIPRYSWKLWAPGLAFFTLLFTVRLFVPSRLDPKYAPRSEYGLVPVECSSQNTTATGVDIIFVHGLGSNPDTMWQRLVKNTLNHPTSTHPEDKVYINWINDFLCEDLPEGLRGDIRIFLYNYDSYWQRDAVEERSSRLGQDLFEEVISLVVKSPERNFILVGHSYGGLVIKEVWHNVHNTDYLVLSLAFLAQRLIMRLQALIKAQVLQSRRPVNGFRQIKAVMFLGTPHRGSNSASLGLRVAQLFRAFGLNANPSILKALLYDSVGLQDIHQQFEYISENLRIINFYEKRKTVGAYWGFWSDFVVSEQSATLGGPNTETIGLHTDHSGMNKFAERDSNYKRIVRKLIELTGEILEGSPQRARLSQNEVPEPSNEYSVVLSFNRRRNPDFTGRETTLLQLDNKLRPRGAESLSVVAIYGIGGIGKTELAVEYAHRHRKTYSSIFWIDATTEDAAITSVETSLQSIVRHCEVEGLVDGPRYQTIKKLLESNQSQLSAEKYRHSLKELLVRWLGQDENRAWLLVIDNVDNSKGFNFREVVPWTISWGSVIIITRRLDLATTWDPIEISQMRQDEAIDLLKKSSKINSSLGRRDMESSQRVVKLLAYYPPAISEAGAYISLHQQDDPITAYLQRILEPSQSHSGRDQRHEVRSHIPGNEINVNVWETSLVEMQERDPNAARLLLTCSFLDRTNIQEEMFLYWKEASYRDPTIERSFDLLVAYSFLNQQIPGRYYMHPFLHRWLRSQLSLDDKKTMMKEVLSMLIQYSKQLHHTKNNIQPHVKVILSIYKDIYPCDLRLQGKLNMSSLDLDDSRERRSMLHRISTRATGWLMWAQGFVDEMRLIIYRLCGVSGMTDVMEAQKQLDELRYILKEEDELGMTSWVLCHSLDSFPIKHPRVLEVFGNYAHAKYATRQFEGDEGSLVLYRWLLASRTQVLGPYHPATAGAMMGLGLSLVHQDQKRCDEGISYILDAYYKRLHILGYHDVLTENAFARLMSTAGQCHISHELVSKISIEILKYTDARGLNYALRGMGYEGTLHMVMRFINFLVSDDRECSAMPFFRYFDITWTEAAKSITNKIDEFNGTQNLIDVEFPKTWGLRDNSLMNSNDAYNMEKMGDGFESICKIARSAAQTCLWRSIIKSEQESKEEDVEYQSRIAVWPIVQWSRPCSRRYELSLNQIELDTAKVLELWRPEAPGERRTGRITRKITSHHEIQYIIEREVISFIEVEGCEVEEAAETDSIPEEMMDFKLKAEPVRANMLKEEAVIFELKEESVELDLTKEEMVTEAIVGGARSLDHLHRLGSEQWKPDGIDTFTIARLPIWHDLILNDPAYSYHLTLSGHWLDLEAQMHEANAILEHWSTIYAGYEGSVSLLLFAHKYQAMVYVPPITRYEWRVGISVAHINLRLSRGGIGTDICRISRIYKNLTSDAGVKFVHRILTPQEIQTPPASRILQPVFTYQQDAADALKNTKNAPRDLKMMKAAEFMAGRFAAKEATIKAYGSRRLYFQDIVITYERTLTNNPEHVDEEPDKGRYQNSPPVAVIKGNTAYLDAEADEYASLSITHDGDYAVAMCLAFRKQKE